MPGEIEPVTQVVLNLTSREVELLSRLAQATGTGNFEGFIRRVSLPISEWVLGYQGAREGIFSMNAQQQRIFKRHDQVGSSQLDNFILFPHNNGSGAASK